MRTAMILAAGYGTRLRPLTDVLPKPLVWVGDRPAAAHVVARLARAGFERVVLNTHHLPEAFDPAELGSANVAMSLVHEPTILGTAGGVRNAALGEGEVVVWNGDIAADLDPAALAASHDASGALATIAVAPLPLGQGTVGLGADGRVVRLRGERFGDETSGGDFVGIQAFGAAFRERLPLVGCLVGDGYLPALRSGEQIGSFAFDGWWSDIGSPAGYLDANLHWLEARGIASFVGEGARLAPGVRLRRSVVGAGATVEGEGELDEVIVWPRAVTHAPLARAIAARSVLRIP